MGNSQHSEPVILGPRYAVRIGDLKPDHRLQLKCFVCDKSRLIDPMVLRARFKGYQRVVDIEQKFKCQHCGNKSMNTWQVVKLVFDD